MKYFCEKKSQKKKEIKKSKKSMKKSKSKKLMKKSKIKKMREDIKKIEKKTYTYTFSDILISK